MVGNVSKFLFNFVIILYMYVITQMIYRKRGGIGEFCSQPKMYFAAFKINIHVFVSLTSSTYAEMCTGFIIFRQNASFIGSFSVRKSLRDSTINDVH